jgi:hypothetical protein
MRENEHVPSNVPYPTRTGVKIGLLYKSPPPDTHHDGDLLQRALLRPEDDPFDELGRLAIAVLALIAAAIVLLCVFLFV